MTSNPDTLAVLNSATLGAAMPVVTLPDGSKIQTGTVGALLVNIREYDQLISGSSADEGKKKELEEKMAASMPVLKKAGLFGLFRPDEWINGGSPGRKFVGDLAMREGL
ncbi:uncharacterized protein N0V89_011337 [Didymosphaeria variabile]|uniref:DUF7709 domain-containing protein n=1 Tax=Didymosphaeria variabile TaxID=1932322 RepID=A0A9W8XB31_9PLEO|nr:uncharacterized protein N0V89_011337 [Didymosphaeria variabile]KAJ4345208.1 hypothetical protein N0V89_011337 [Didymosphaeria variabile]